MIISCVKWGDKFSYEHVNRLYAMCTKQFNESFRFVCYTDDPRGLHPYILRKPLEQEYDLENWWWKLRLFKEPALVPEMFFDLDVVLQNDITHFKDYCEKSKLRLIEAYWKPYELTGTDMNYNSSVMIWHGDLTSIWSEFMKDPDYYMVKYNGIDSYLYYHHYDKLNVFPKGEIYSRLYGIDENNYFKAGTKSKPLFRDDTYPVCIFNGWRRKTEYVSGKYLLDDDGYDGFEHYWN